MFGVGAGPSAHSEMVGFESFNFNEFDCPKGIDLESPGWRIGLSSLIGGHLGVCLASVGSANEARFERSCTDRALETEDGPLGWEEELCGKLNKVLPRDTLRACI